MSEQAQAAPVVAAPQAPEVNNTPSVTPNQVPTSGLDKLAQAVDAKLAKQNTPELTTPPVSVEEQKQVAKKIKQLKLKVYGQEMTEDLPFEIDDNPEVVDYLTKQLQLGKAAQRAMQEKGTFEKQVQSFVENLKGNTAEVLAQMGIDPTQFAAELLQKEIEKSQLSPLEREKIELQDKLKKLEQESKQKEEDFNKREFEAIQKQKYEQIETQMISALGKSDLPFTPYVTKGIANYMLLGLQNNIELTPEDVLPLVREDILGDLQQMFKSMSEDKVEALIGKDIFNKVRKKNVAKATQKLPTPATEKATIKDVGQKSKQEVKGPEKKISARDFFGI